MLRKLLMVTSFPLNLLSYRRQTWKLVLMSLVTVPTYARAIDAFIPDAAPVPVVSTVSYDATGCKAEAREASAEVSATVGGEPVVVYENDSYTTDETGECYLDVMDLEGDGE